MSDYYNVLGVDPTASSDQIKAAYRKLILRWHPDRHPNCSELELEQISEQFKNVQQAYEVIGNTERRRTYDNNGRTQPESFIYTNDVDSIFRSVARNTSDSMARNFQNKDMINVGVVTGAIGAIGGFLLGSIIAGSGSAVRAATFPSLFASMGGILGASAPMLYFAVQDSIARLDGPQRQLLIDMVMQLMEGYAEEKRQRFSQFNSHHQNY
jgi:curved DNA-binding protein CbpA